MSTTAIIVIVFFAFLSTFVQRVTGFGFGILFMTAAPHIMATYGEATALSGTLALVCAIVTGIRFAKYIPWKKLVPILLAFLVVSFFAVRVVKEVNGGTLKHVLGVILIVVAAYFYFFSKKIHLRPTVPVQMTMGTLSGITGGLFGIQGPPAVIYFVSCTEKKEEYMAITQWYFIIGNIAMSLYRAGNGFMTADVGKGWIAGVGGVLLGLWLGEKVYNKVPAGTIRKFVYIFIAVAGILAILS